MQVGPMRLAEAHCQLSSSTTAASVTTQRERQASCNHRKPQQRRKLTKCENATGVGLSSLYDELEKLRPRSTGWFVFTIKTQDGPFSAQLRFLPLIILSAQPKDSCPTTLINPTDIRLYYLLPQLASSLHPPKFFI